MYSIVTIDDDTNVTQLLAILLRDHGFQVESADCGAAGVALVQAKLPDLVLCDVEMPDLNGFEVLQHLRADPKTADIPLVFLTGNVALTDVRTGMQLGADDYLGKPFSANELVAVIEKRCAMRDAQRQREKDRMRQWAADFARTLNHELRTPLCGIVGVADLFEYYYRSGDQSAIQSMCDSLRDGSDRLRQAVDRLLLYSELLDKVDNNRGPVGGGDVIPSDGTIGHIANQVAARWSRSADLALQLSPGSVLIRPDLLQTAATEAVDNAFKFSKTGERVTVQSSVDGADFTLTVIDAGVGMNEAQIRSVVALRQFNRSQREQQGIGLGLALLRLIVVIHRGDLSIVPNTPKGLNVSLRFPGIVTSVSAESQGGFSF
jgi:two-component system sensor histidine kinase/response regulator